MYRLHESDVRARAPRDNGVRSDGTMPGRHGPGYAVMLSIPPTEVMAFTYTSNLSEVRARVLSYARRAGLPDARARDLVIAVSEVAANTFRHARSAGTLDIWHDQNEIVCEIRDKGVITDPLAGKRRPASDALAGHGLWLVHQLCDLVELLSGEDGTTIRMHMLLKVTDAGT